MTRIKTIKQLTAIVDEIRWQRFWDEKMEFYRGHGLRDYKLLPNISRHRYTVNEFKEIESLMFKDFSGLFNQKNNLIRQPFNTDDKELQNKWYALFQGQHIGLKTRLMDWSIRWETALMFAVENEKQHGIDGSLWIFRPMREHEYNSPRLKEITCTVDPTDLEVSCMINSPSYWIDENFEYVGERRLGRQAGRFWIQPISKSIIPLDEQEEFRPHLTELIIDGASKAIIKEELIQSGVTIDWHYYRRDENIDKTLKNLNDKYLK